MLIKVGNTTINTDNVVEFIEGPSELKIVTVAAYGGGVPLHSIRLKGEEMIAVVRWLNNAAENLMPESDDDREWQEFKDAGGNMTRACWEGTRRLLRDLLRDQDRSYSDRRMHRISELEVKLRY